MNCSKLLSCGSSDGRKNNEFQLIAKMYTHCRSMLLSVKWLVFGLFLAAKGESGHFFQISDPGSCCFCCSSQTTTVRKGFISIVLHADISCFIFLFLKAHLSSDCILSSLPTFISTATSSPAFAACLDPFCLTKKKVPGISIWYQIWSRNES